MYSLVTSSRSSSALKWSSFDREPPVEDGDCPPSAVAMLRLLSVCPARRGVLFITSERHVSAHLPRRDRVAKRPKPNLHQGQTALNLVQIPCSKRQVPVTFFLFPRPISPLPPSISQTLFPCVPLCCPPWVSSSPQPATCLGPAMGSSRHGGAMKVAMTTAAGRTSGTGLRLGLLATCVAATATEPLGRPLWSFQVTVVTQGKEEREDCVQHPHASRSACFPS